MAKKKANKNRSAREEARWQEELAMRKAKKDAEVEQGNKVVIVGLAIASVLIAAIVTFA